MQRDECNHRIHIRLRLPAVSSPRLEAAAVVAGRLAEVLGAVAAEVGEGCEVHAVGYLR